MCITIDLPTGQDKFFMHKSQDMAHHAVLNALWYTESTIYFSVTPHSTDGTLVSAAPCRLKGKEI